MALKTLLLLLLLAALEARLATRSPPGRSMPGSPHNISRDDRGLRQVVLDAACAYNNRSNDAFLFRPSCVRRAQRQVVKGIRYIVDFDISRTVCRKRENRSLSDCDFQPVGRLQQTFRCHTEIWKVAWRNKTVTQVFSCKP
ncbi:cystatin-F [Betta splendens]|uniref:Cystatin-F n=1 Tax=Betta splendens TaxID=158456 RepID=A0A6P7KQ07_BETSP|nr:cystatin-F [Betta splendens]